jgi:hypothetical protein
MTEHGRDGVEILKLTKWELGNLRLPPVTTVTLYEGAAHRMRCGSLPSAT